MSPRRSAIEGLPEPIKGRIAIVGGCASGKSMLVDRLRARGYDARQCAQEHSYVADMWQRLSRPKVLVYLDVSLEAAKRRRRLDYGRDYLEEQRRRLSHARQHCDIYVDTTHLSEAKVFRQVVLALEALALKPRPEGPV